MNPNPDDDLLATFARARECDHEDAPAWRPELLDRPMSRPRTVLRWVPAALVTACVMMMAVFFALPSRHVQSLSEALPPLLDSPPGELFASLEPAFTTFDAPSDFLLPTHLNHSIP